MYSINAIDYSSLNSFYSKKPYRGFSVKYVIDGIEMYHANGKNYKVKNKEYLLANAACEGFAEVNSKSLVKGVCICIDPKLIDDVCHSLLYNGQIDVGADFKSYLNSETFLENKYNSHSTKVGQLLMNLENKILTQNFAVNTLDSVFYFDLTERIIADQIHVFKQVNQIKLSKLETKKDVYRKLLMAKDYIESNYTKEINIDALAQLIGMSEYHFYRLFKQAFLVSPYQYILKLKFNLAKELIQKEQLSIIETAELVGFSDVFTFSKLFKKKFGFSPSQLNK